MKAITKNFFTLIFIAVLGLSVALKANAQTQKNNTSAKKTTEFTGNKEAQPYTQNLADVDKVELLKLKLRGDLWDGEIEATKTIEGEDAKKIAALWRGQTYKPYSADCHNPAYTIKFYSQEKMIVYTSLCWDCDNIDFIEPNLEKTQGFAGKSKKGKELLKVFSDAFPKQEDVIIVKIQVEGWENFPVKEWQNSELFNRELIVPIKKDFSNRYTDKIAFAYITGRAHPPRNYTGKIDDSPLPPNYSGVLYAKSIVDALHLNLSGYRWRF